MKPPFEDCAEDYASFRPDYPQALYDFLIESCRLDANSLIVDIGAGTGKASALLATSGFRVIAIDRGERMLRAGPPYTAVVKAAAAAEAVPVGDRTADLILCAQAFHWFRVDEALGEFRRTLKNSGRLALVWNVRSHAPSLQQDYDRLILKYNPQHRCRYRETDWTAVIEPSGFQVIARRSFDHRQSMSVEAWKGLARSTSYIRSIGDAEFAAFEHELGEILAAAQGSIDMLYRTDLWLASVNQRMRDE